MTDAAKLDQCLRQYGTATVEAGLGPYCEKCGACFAEDASFGEGFCDPFWDAASSTFDQAKCTAEGDPWDITDRTLTASELTSMSCTDFDTAI